MIQGFTMLPGEGGYYLCYNTKHNQWTISQLLDDDVIAWLSISKTGKNRLLASISINGLQLSTTTRDGEDPQKLVSSPMFQHWILAVLKVEGLIED